MKMNKLFALCVGLALTLSGGVLCMSCSNNGVEASRRRHEYTIDMHTTTLRGGAVPRQPRWSSSPAGIRRPGSGQRQQQQQYPIVTDLDDQIDDDTSVKAKIDSFLTRDSRNTFIGRNMRTTKCLWVGIACLPAALFLSRSCSARICYSIWTVARHCADNCVLCSQS